MRNKPIALSALCCLLLTACGNAGNVEPTPDSSGIASPGITSSETTSSVSENNEQPLVNHDNPIVYYTKEEAAEIIGKTPNLKPSSEMYLLAPKEIDHVSEFKASTSPQLPPEKELEEFRQMFAYLFPDHELDEECLYAYAVTDADAETSDSRLHTLNDPNILNEYLNGTLGDQQYLHHLIYTEKQKPKENSVSLYYRSPFGNDLCEFNKGVFDRFVADKEHSSTYYAGESVHLDRNCKTVESLTPDSENVFTLLDGKEISIKDAAAFYENYINAIPTEQPSVFKIHVDRVDVYQADGERYALKFINSRMYDNIPFDYIWDGVDAGSDRDMSFGVMVRTNDVDYTYATFRAHRGFDEVQHTEIVSLEAALNAASQELTDYVIFEVERAELVYRWKETPSAAAVQVGDDRCPVSPAWKFLLYNPNDGTRHAAFVDAISGETQIR